MATEGTRWTQEEHVLSQGILRRERREGGKGRGGKGRKGREYSRNMRSYHRQLVRDHSYKALALGSVPASKDDGTVYPSGRSYMQCFAKMAFNREHQYARRALRVNLQFLSRRHTHSIAWKPAEYELISWLYSRVSLTPPPTPNRQRLRATRPSLPWVVTDRSPHTRPLYLTDEQDYRSCRVG